MCNLGEGIWEDAVRESTEWYINRMYEDGLNLERIARITEKTIEEVKAIIEKKELVAV